MCVPVLVQEGACHELGWDPGPRLLATAMGVAMVTYRPCLNVTIPSLSHPSSKPIKEETQDSGTNTSASFTDDVGGGNVALTWAHTLGFLSYFPPQP